MLGTRWLEGAVAWPSGMPVAGMLGSVRVAGLMAASRLPACEAASRLPACEAASRAGWRAGQ